MAIETKRQNFNITPEQEAELAWLRETLGAPTAKDAILRAVRVLAMLARESQYGRKLFLGTSAHDLTRVLIPELETVGEMGWKYLVPRPHAWRRQLYVKGRRLSAFAVWMDMLENEMTPEQTAGNWDLPMEAVTEIIRYCESNRELLEMEAAEERRHLLEGGVQLEPPTAR